MPQFLDGGEVPAGLVDVQIGDAQSAFCTMTDLVHVKLGDGVGWETLELGINPPWPRVLLWRDLFGHFFLRPLALAPMRRLRIVHQRSARKRLLAWHDHAFNAGSCQPPHLPR